MSTPRSILKILYAREQAEGVGAKVRRSIGTIGMRHFTPFLMLDHFNVAKGAGFPDHPHRGQETVTLLMKGSMLHEDFTGSSGVLRPGDLQFMTAGRGVCHSEMPYSPDGENVVGMQLWVDLPRELKNSEPRYRDLRREEIPVVTPNDKVKVSVISGKSYGTESVKELAYTPIEYYHFTVKPGGEFEQKVPKDFNAFVYLLDGELEIDGQKVPKFNAVFFERDGDSIKGKVPEDGKESNFVLLAGKVLDQPIVQYGPFVETSNEEISQAFSDYQRAANGFERAKGWESKIGSGVTPEIYEEIKNKEAA
ncbi:DEKNAAC100775 [Brettanomyces naardenensis]|uniref:DEKNAAC100775 n=1 Tax=Brettanomyces naardenensis TaxID=13370 RepID=A0A448YFS0_BRENA|nr:DEKNAAC100775 [Brettanomyces naardenensis]